MDPDATLRELRQHAARALSDEDRASRDAMLDALEMFVALDTWIARGGFLPRDWQPSTRSEK